MTLKLTLKPGESVYIGHTRLTVASQATCTVYVDGVAPVLRANEMIGESDIAESVSRFRYVLQQMYLGDDVQAMLTDYVDAVSQLLAERPDLTSNVHDVNQMVRIGRLYEAVKIGRKMSEPRTKAV